MHPFINIKIIDPLEWFKFLSVLNMFCMNSKKRYIIIINKDEQLNALMTKLNNDGDYSSFIDNITKVYTDYTTYENNNGKIDIKYPLEGFEIKFGYDKNNGITIYDNFQGKIVDNKTLTDIQKDGNIPNNLYILYDNLMFQETYDTLE